MRSFGSRLVLIRAFLAWFMLTLGAAIASPMVKPQQVGFVCTGSGFVKLVVGDGDGDLAATASHTLECPACLPVALPLPAATFEPPAVVDARLDPPTCLPALIAAPALLPPPRGPPSLH